MTGAGSAPIESALVLAWKGSEVYTKARTNSSGQVTLDVSPTTPGPMTLSVNAHNYFLHVDTVQVISTARYVAYLRSSIYDPTPGGNGDSILNPGETVSIPTWVKNWGSLSATGVTAKLRTHDANAQVTDSSKSFGTINAGDSAYTGLAGFCLHVNTGLANGYAVPCSLICKDALDSTWVSMIAFGVGAPVLDYQSFVVCDSLTGNNNGKVDPGEDANIKVDHQERWRRPRLQLLGEDALGRFPVPDYGLHLHLRPDPEGRHGQQLLSHVHGSCRRRHSA